MKRILGRLETQLLAYVQMRRLNTVRLGELKGALGITRTQEANLLSRLARAGLIARVSRGVYLVPPRVPLGGRWSPDEILALDTLMTERRGRYQICGPNAFNRYGFTAQVPARVYAYNNRISGTRTIGAVTLTLIEVADQRLGDTDEVRTADGVRAVYSSRARTLVDAVYDWSRFGSLPRAFDWIRTDMAAGRVNAKELVRLTLRYGNTGTVRRIGALLEREGVDGALLRKLERAVGQSTSLIPWIPTRPKRGTVDRRWGVVLNEPAGPGADPAARGCRAVRRSGELHGGPDELPRPADREGLLLHRPSAIPGAGRGPVGFQGRHLPGEGPRGVLPAQRGPGLHHPDAG